MNKQQFCEILEYALLNFDDVLQVVDPNVRSARQEFIFEKINNTGGN